MDSKGIFTSTFLGEPTFFLQFGTKVYLINLFYYVLLNTPFVKLKLNTSFTFCKSIINVTLFLHKKRIIKSFSNFIILLNYDILK